MESLMYHRGELQRDCSCRYANEYDQYLPSYMEHDKHDERSWVCNSDEWVENHVFRASGIFLFLYHLFSFNLSSFLVGSFSYADDNCVCLPRTFTRIIAHSFGDPRPVLLSQVIPSHRANRAPRRRKQILPLSRDNYIEVVCVCVCVSKMSNEPARF